MPRPIAWPSPAPATTGVPAGRPVSRATLLGQDRRRSRRARQARAVARGCSPAASTSSGCQAAGRRCRAGRADRRLPVLVTSRPVSRWIEEAADVDDRRSASRSACGLVLRQPGDARRAPASGPAACRSSRGSLSRPSSAESRATCGRARSSSHRIAGMSGLPAPSISVKVSR